MKTAYFSILCGALVAFASSQVVAGDFHERRQEIRQEARIEARTEARVERRREHHEPVNNIIIINNAMIRTVSYNGIVLLHDMGSQKFYRSMDNGYVEYKVPYGAKVVELAGTTPTTINVIQP